MTIPAVTLTAVTRDGTEYTAVVGVAAIIAAERKFKKPVGELFAPVSMEILAFLAWESIRAAGQTLPPFEQFAGSLVDIQTDADDPDPLVASL